MGTAPERAQSGSLLRGRWQVPLALVAAVVGAVTLYRLAPPVPPRDFDTLLADIAVLEHAGDPLTAADAVANLLETQPPLPSQQRAVLHERLAELLFHIEQGRSEHHPENLSKIVNHDRLAVELGRPASPRAAFRDALTSRWLGDRPGALAKLKELLSQELNTAEMTDVLRALLDLVAELALTPAERLAILEQCLASPQLSPPYFWAVLQQAVAAALEERRPDHARELIERHAAQLTTSDRKGYLDYLRALVLLHERRLAEAEPLIQWVLQSIAQAPRRPVEFDQFGHLPSLSHVLLGRLRLAQDRPQDAVAELERALEMHPDAPLRAQAAVELGRARAQLGAHEEARQAFEMVLRLIRKGRLAAGSLREDLLQTLTRLHDQRRAAGDFRSAVAYLALAGELRASDSADKHDEADDPLAWQRLERAADGLAPNEPRLAEFLWWAAQEYGPGGGAGRPADEYRALERFIHGRSNDPRVPQALLRLGQACEAGGMADDALRWYARLRAEYPRLPESTWAALGTARLWMTRGPDQQEQAGQLLAELLAGDRASPDAEVFRAALLVLCELLLGTERYGEAIGRLEEFRELYSDGPDGWQARFMLADAYRRSAMALRAAPPPGTPPEAAAAESQARFRLAAQHFDELVRDLDAQPDLDPSLETYTRLALLYLGDCHFELNDLESLKAALRTYSAVAMRYPHDPAALAAGTQLANTYLRLGDPAGAARALESARWALRNTPTDLFRERGAPDAADWDRLLTLATTSGLFENTVETAAWRPEERP